MSLEMNLATIRKLTKRVPIDAEQIAGAIEDARVAERRMAMSLQALEDLAIPRRRRDESIDVGDVVRDVAGLVGANTQTSRVRIEADVEPGLPPILGDVAMVREAVLSLVVSAIDQVAAGSAPPGAPAHESPSHLPIRMVAKRDGTSHLAVIVEYARAGGPGEGVEEPSWDTSESPARSSRCITALWRSRWTPSPVARLPTGRSTHPSRAAGRGCIPVQRATRLIPGHDAARLRLGRTALRGQCVCHAARAGAGLRVGRRYVAINLEHVRRAGELVLEAVLEDDFRFVEWLGTCRSPCTRTLCLHSAVGRRI